MDSKIVSDPLTKLDSKMGDILKSMNFIWAIASMISTNIRTYINRNETLKKNQILHGLLTTF